MEYKIYDIEDEETILKKISKLQPLNYNRFKWWRNFTQLKTPLPPDAPLLKKIENGDLEFSHYYWQAKYVEIEINNKYQELQDLEDVIRDTQLDRAKRKRLYEDFERDENDKLNFIKKDFTKEFHISLSQFDDEVIEFDGTLKEFYHHCSFKFKKRIRIKSRKGRPKKNN